MNDKGATLKIITSYLGYNDFYLYINPFSVIILEFLDHEIQEVAVRLLVDTGIIIYQTNNELNKLIYQFWGNILNFNSLI